jgi:serine/threonine protein kinase
VSLIADRYQPLDPLRPGAPQRARDLETAQTVILRYVTLPPRDLDIVLAPARAAKGIFHPSLITLFDVQLLPGWRALLAYEFVQAQSLAQLSGGHPFNARRAAELVTEIADATAELHARGVAHGGISQSTVLVTMKGKAKLDRVGDPSLHILLEPDPGRDLVAMADLLAELVGARQTSLDEVIGHVRSGACASAATLAGMLRQTRH